MTSLSSAFSLLSTIRKRLLLFRFHSIHTLILEGKSFICISFLFHIHTYSYFALYPKQNPFQVITKKRNIYGERLVLFCMDLEIEID